MNNEDREKYIYNDIQSKYNYLVNKGYNVVALFLQGSQNYYLDIYDNDYKSDIDVKAIVLPNLKDIVLNKKPISKVIILDNDEHIEIKDIRVMKEMFIKQNISYIELLYTKYNIINPMFKEYIDKLLDIKDEISTINKNQFLRCIKGMSMEKYKALEHPYPNIMDKIKKFGYDPKQFHHILRLNEFIERYLVNNEKIEDCYISNKRDYLIDVKKGFYSLDDARVLSDIFDACTKEICDRNMDKEEVINYETIEKLDNIVYDIITKSLISELKI